MNWGTFQPRLGPVATADYASGAAAVRKGPFAPGVYTIETSVDAVYALQGSSTVTAVSGDGVKLMAAGPPEVFVVDGDSNAYVSVIGAVANIRIVKRSETT